MSFRQSSTGLFFRRLQANKNAYAMLLAEPMWGIPYNLFIPYMSLYMASLGCSPEQIGLINTVGMAFQVLFTLLAPPVTDRLGRKRTTLIFDIISWSGALLLWIFAQNFWFFIAAAVVQSINRIVHVSWTCMLVEDTEKELLVSIFSWLTIAGLLSAIFAPLAAVVVNRTDVVTAMRWFLGVAFVMMTSMFFLRNAFTRETSVGRTRMAKSRAEPAWVQITALFRVATQVRRNGKTLFFFILSALYNIAVVVKAPFFALLLTETLGFTEAAAGYFAAAASFVMLLIYLFAQPLLARLRPRAPLSAGLVLCAGGALVLMVASPNQWVNLALVLVSVVLTAAGTAVVQPLIEGISHASMDNDKRSQMTSLLYTLTLCTSAPFGIIGGRLYSLNARFPFLAASVLFFLCMIMMLVLYRDKPAKEA